MRRPRKAAAVPVAGLALALALALTGCGSDDSAAATGSRPELEVTGAYMPAPVTDTMAAGFFTVTNSGGTDTLTSVTSDLSDDVTLHSTKGGAMEEEKSFAIPADGTLAFSSGGNHLMFEKLTHRPHEGEKVSLTLHFARTGTVKVSMPVKSATYNPKTGH
ncbi:MULTISPECIES: copper chaperone PCu(A)C [unclassified Streptomyces]|uniref:copper chaperone PCu(A)C n=1 Tax=unclassified Streptomyces TaxID=2593676 RepID=UPI0011CE4853|nr:copper chaperone PCu(A)C [Streptomyces sp. me109]TXS76981.1 copper chaperone PCu(A)C [Streptomyces sp. me109]